MARVRLRVSSEDCHDHCTMVRVRVRVARRRPEGQVIKGIVNHSKAHGFYFLYKGNHWRFKQGKWIIWFTFYKII